MSVIWKRDSEYAGLGVSRFWFNWFNPNVRRPNKKIMNSNKPTLEQIEINLTHLPKDLQYSFSPKTKKEFPQLGSERTKYELPPDLEENLEQLVKDKAQEGLGAGLLRLGIALAIPEGSELILPWTGADEVAGIVLITVGLVLLFGESIF